MKTKLTKGQREHLEEQHRMLCVILDGLGEDNPWSPSYNLDRRAYLIDAGVDVEKKWITSVLTRLYELENILDPEENKGDTLDSYLKKSGYPRKKKEYYNETIKNFLKRDSYLIEKKYFKEKENTQD